MNHCSVKISVLFNRLFLLVRWILDRVMIVSHPVIIQCALGHRFLRFSGMADAHYGFDLQVLRQTEDFLYILLRGLFFIMFPLPYLNPAASKAERLCNHLDQYRRNRAILDPYVGFRAVCTYNNAECRTAQELRTMFFCFRQL